MNYQGPYTGWPTCMVLVLINDFWTLTFLDNAMIFTAADGLYKMHDNMLNSAENYDSLGSKTSKLAHWCHCESCLLLTHGLVISSSTNQHLHFNASAGKLGRCDLHLACIL